MNIHTETDAQREARLYAERSFQAPIALRAASAPPVSPARVTRPSSSCVQAAWAACRRAALSK